MKKIITVCFILLCAASIMAQASKDSVIAEIDRSIKASVKNKDYKESKKQIEILNLYKNASESKQSTESDKISNTKSELKDFQIGVSAGFLVTHRTITKLDKKTIDRFRLDTYIIPKDTSLQIDLKPFTSFNLSVLITYYPFESEKHKCWNNFGFVGNFSLAEFSSANSGLLFNKQIAGGLGVAYRWKKFAVSGTAEIVLDRRLRDYYVEGYLAAKANGTPYKISDSYGKAITSLDEKNDTYFKTDNLIGGSLRFVYYLNSNK